jgi:hypothetical protein
MERVFLRGVNGTLVNSGGEDKTEWEKYNAGVAGS